MTQYIQKLPAVFQTVTEKKFFDATIDQVFSKKDSDLLHGYLGQRIPGQYNPVSDFYIPEPTKDRTWWQLEATAFSRNDDSTKSNIFFYDDLLNRINYYGGNTLNQDRLFESEYYSWAPPIDYDMFINYQNYYWIEQGLNTISISAGVGEPPILFSDIAGKSSYTTPATATPPNLTLTNGLNILLLDDPDWQIPLTVENIGGCADLPILNNSPTGGIRLIRQYPDYTSGSILEFLPWDGTVQLATGRTIQNTNWDTSAWDVQPQPGNGDYITIERGSLDENAWSRTNKWYHIDAITKTVATTGTPFPSNASRALRPIIQFNVDLVLYNSGTTFKSDITYGFRNDSNSNPFLLSAIPSDLNSASSILGVTLRTGQIVVFMEDASTMNTLFTVAVDDTLSTVTFIPYSTSVVSGDIVFATDTSSNDGPIRGQTWYFDNNMWQQVSNDKVSNNQPPLFQLYDHNGNTLNNAGDYPDSNFGGNKIFSYKVNSTPGATVDPVLKFPLVYTSLGQASDILFQNNLITDRYTYGIDDLPIDGYYYFKKSTSTVLYNNWNLYSPGNCDTNQVKSVSKQRVIDKFVVGYGSEYQFKLSVTPYGYPSDPDLIVSINNTEIKNAATQLNGYTFITINSDLYIDLEQALSGLLLTPQSQPPVVEVQTYTHDNLLPESTGYFEIPQQLNANPNQQEIVEISASNLIQQFSSIIENQEGFTGIAFGGNNNYKDGYKNNTVGSFILQNVAPTLKTMLISSDANLDIIAGIRFSQDEYTKFKNKYLSIAQQLINQEFNPLKYHSNEIILSAWVEAILKTVNISKEFSNAFAYSYMIANGTPHYSEACIVPSGGLVTLSNYIDLSNPENSLYIYDTTGNERLLVIGVDYEIESSNLVIDLKFNTQLVGNNVYVALYKNPLPAYIPSTPTKVGAYNTYIPRVEWDTSYTIPTWVIIGHDGSKSIIFGSYDQSTGIFSDYRDPLLLELETRIYNLLQYRFRNQYNPPVRLEDVRPGYFRETRYTRQEYLDITESYLNKWCAKNKANYRVNDWLSSSADLPVNSPELWKLYNYRNAIDSNGAHLNLPGNWKGIFQYYYDTIYPSTRPWEMLGFSIEPSWWVNEYGADWSSLNINLWADLEDGIIRQGPRAIVDPGTLEPLPQQTWARPGLSLIIPVNDLGEIKPIPELFNIAMSGNAYAPFDGFDGAWTYGDGAPVEQAWMSTSGYAFSVQEFLYLMKPGPFGELMFDTLGTEISAGKIVAGDAESPVSSVNWQYVQNDIYDSGNAFFSWMRPKNKDQVVHAEKLNNIVQVRYGYQRWISDRILFLGKDVSATFGQKVRTLDVNLANKLAGFTNKDTTSVHIESVSTSASSTSFLIPSNNFEVILHKGQPIKTYSYSGVVVRALTDGTFAVYGYDLLNSEFISLDRSNAQAIDVTIGGTPAEYKTYTVGETYYAGDIVRYNGIYYQSVGTVVAGKFDISNWQKLKALPIVGGVSVTYRPISETSFTKYPYGSVLNSAQEVFDLLIGWGAYLETQGWKFTDVNADTNQVSDWLYSAKQFLFWLNANWSPDAIIQLSPSANKATLIVDTGYPADVETTSNGVYSILDKYGIAIPPVSTITDRDGTLISVEPTDLSAGGIYFLQVNATETEHILIFDNTTSFNDIIYDPLLRARQQRLRFNGFRSNSWFGKQEAPGYLIIDNQMVPNFDTIVESMRYYYDPDITIDNPSLEALGRHLIGYESKSYLDNMQVSNDVQYLFYQGAIRQKGTVQSFDKLFRSNKVQSDEVIEVYEEWALKLGDFGNTIEQVSTEFILTPEQNTNEVIVTRLNFIPSEIGFVKEINILNAENVYKSVPKIVISAPDAPLTNTLLTQAPRQARAYAVLNAAGIISRIDITDPGYGYLTAPTVTIDSGTQPHDKDVLYSVWQGEITRDIAADNIIEIDIDNTDVWTVRPIDTEYSLEFPTTDNIEYSLPNAGYVHFNDVTWSSFDVTQTAVGWGTSTLNPKENDTLWVAKTFTEDWGVYKLVNITQSTLTPNKWKVVKDDADNLLLLTDHSIESTLDVIPQDQAKVSAKLVNGYVSSINVTLGGTGYVTPPAVYITGGNGSGAIATAIIVNGSVTSVTITNGGTGFTSIPDVVISAPPSGVQALASANILASVDIQGIDNVGGFFSTTPGITILGAASSAEPALAVATINANGQLASVTMTELGAGYTTIPTVVIGEPDTITPAVLVPVVDSTGSIVDVTITTGGSGYTVGATIVANRAITTGGPYIDATFSINSTDSIGAITSISVTNAGINTGYQPVLGDVIIPQLAIGVVDNETDYQTDFGNMICLQIVDNNVVLPETNYAVTFIASGTYTDPETLILYNSYNLLTLDGNPITAIDIPVYNEFTDLLLFKTMRFTELPASIPTYVIADNKIWVDSIDNKWKVLTYTPSSITEFTPYRAQEKLINTSLFESVKAFQTSTQSTLALLPVYDPFKSILPALVKQNISYMLFNDPVRYNVSGDIRSYSQNITFGEAQVGKLWWDLSNVRYTYYEQPIALDGSETATDNLIYRRDRWGQIFPGSIITIYEWTRSDVPPALYTGTGVPRSTTEYIQITKSNRFTNAYETTYYFWVLNATDKPNVENRTLAATEVARLILSPKSQGFAFFAPIQQTLSNNAYMFYNVQGILANQGNNIQIQYRLAERNDQKHTQWKFFREGDTGSLVTDQFWDKLVDSICAYTKVLPTTDEWANVIPVTQNSVDGYILPVPDPALSNSEKYGISVRPRQSMFKDIYAARKVFVQASNNLLKHIAIRDNNASWNINVSTDVYWAYINWYETGYENVTPTVVFSTLTEAQSALSAGTLSTGTIVEVINGTADGRFILYAVIQLSETVTTQSFKKVAIESSAIKLLDTVYTSKNIYALSVELRELLDAFRTTVMIDSNIVDQNELYFSMLNYVYSEQKNIDWTFKTSYIYIKENNIPLSQPTIYVPNQINNIISYITDAKPYHTQIRDYTSTYVSSDIATGTAEQWVNSKVKLTFGPRENPNYTPEQNTLDAVVGWDLAQGGNQDPWDGDQIRDGSLTGAIVKWDISVDALDNILSMNDILNQYVSYNPELPASNPLTTIPWDSLTPVALTRDLSKQGLSNLFTYTFMYNDVNVTLDNPQSFIAPENIVSVKINDITLTYGINYFAEYISGTYIVYFFEDPAITGSPVAYLLFDGGNMLNVNFDTYRNELALGYGIDNFVVNVDTKLLINDNNGVKTAFSDMWDVYDPVINDILIINGGQPMGWDSSSVTMWDQDVLDYKVELDYTISFKENLTSDINNVRVADPEFGTEFYRNADLSKVILYSDLSATTAGTLDVIQIHVDPVIHALNPFVLPDPVVGYPAPAIWINGERIEYRELDIITPQPGLWELRSVRRGTQGTMPDNHSAESYVFVEKFNKILTPNINSNAWNAVSTFNNILPISGTNIPSVPLGGLWYAQTAEAIFLKNELGSAIKP